MAWLERRDGTVVIGRGPFEAAAEIPAAATAFYVQDFALQDPRPWKLPATLEVIDSGEFAARHATVLVSGHALAQLGALCTRFLVLRAGHVAADVTRASLQAGGGAPLEARLIDLVAGRAADSSATAQGAA